MSARTTWIAADAAKLRTVIKDRQGNSLQFAIGTTLRLRLALMENAALDALAGFTAITVEVKPVGADENTAAIIQKVLSGGSINSGLTLAQWTALSASHLDTTFTSGEMNNLNAGTYLLCVWGVEGAIKKTWLSQTFVALQDGCGETTVAPGPVDSYYTAAEVDSMLEGYLLRNDVFVENIAALRNLGLGLGVGSFIEGATVLVRGYYAEGDGGGGLFYWDALSTTADNGGTVLLPTGHLGAGRWKRLYSGAVNVRWFGAKGDWNGVTGTDDTTGILAANALLLEGGAYKDRRGTLYFPRGRYLVMPAALVFDVSLASYEADGAEIVTTASGVALRISGSVGPANQPYGVVTQHVSGFSVQGPGSSVSGSVGVAFGSISGSHPVGPAHLKCERLNVTGFERGITFGDDCYALNFTSCDVFDCAVGVYDLFGANAGENYSYFKCLFYGCGICFKTTNPNADHYFTGCSFDYSSNLYDISGSYVVFYGCHFEWNASTEFPCKASGGARVHHDNGMLLYTNLSGGRMAEFLSITGNAKVQIVGTLLHNIDPLNGRIAYSSDGTGRLHIERTTSYELTNSSRVTLAVENLIKDGGFESGFGCLGGITADTAPITSLRTGANINVTRDTAQKRSGAYSLKLTKTFGGGSAAAFTFFVPVRPGCRYGGSVFTKSDNPSGSGWRVSRGFCSAQAVGGVVEVYGSRELGDTSYSMPSASGWNEFAIQPFPQDQIPLCGENYFYVTIDLFATYEASVWVDDFSMFQF